MKRISLCIVGIALMLSACGSMPPPPTVVYTCWYEGLRKACGYVPAPPPGTRLYGYGSAAVVIVGGYYRPVFRRAHSHRRWGH